MRAVIATIPGPMSTEVLVITSPLGVSITDTIHAWPAKSMLLT